MSINHIDCWCKCGNCVLVDGIGDIIFSFLQVVVSQNHVQELQEGNLQ